MKVAFAGPCGRERFGLQVKTSHRSIKLYFDTKEEASKWKEAINDALAKNRSSEALKSTSTTSEVGAEKWSTVVNTTVSATPSLKGSLRNSTS